MQKQQAWKWKIEANTSWLNLHLDEIVQYKDLLYRFVRRDLLANYQQTILGPFWIMLQPILTTVVYWMIFSKVAKISTDGIPPLLFYLPGIIIWSYFSDCLTGTMYTFLNNTAILSKVYFPRLIIPLSGVIAHSVRIIMQLVLFIGIYIFYLVTSETVHISIYILLIPLLLLLTAAYSLGVGLIISVLTARYRDIDYALQFILRLYMFASPVVYPTSIVPERYKFLFWLNPLTPIIETFRTACFSNGSYHFGYFLISILSTSTILLTGIALFKKKELSVMDII